MGCGGSVVSKHEGGELELVSIMPEPSTIELDHLPLCPRLGCSLAFLASFARRHGTAIGVLDRVADKRGNHLDSLNESEGIGENGAEKGGDSTAFTMSCVMKEIIKGVKTGFEKYSYAELGVHHGTLDYNKMPAFAKATHFVSHAWLNNFHEFVAALKVWLKQSDTSEKGTYFWVDVFTVNQVQAQHYPQEWWSTRFMQVIGDIGNTILVLDSWNSPVTLTRAWVMWEVYCTSASGARLHITMRPAAMAEFQLTLVRSFEQVQTGLGNVDVSASGAFHRQDEKLIHQEIQSTIGYIKLNEVVQTRLQQWLIQETKVVLSKVSHTPGRLMLQENLARMLRESGNLAEAEVSFESLLEELKGIFEDDTNPRVLSCMNQLAVTLQKKGDEQRAMDLHRHCLKWRSRLLGDTNADTLQSASNLAVLLSSQKPLTVENFEQARWLFGRALAGREAMLGSKHPRTLYTVSSLGKLLSEAPVPTAELLEEAEEYHRRAVHALSEVLHKAHPLTLTAMHNQSCHWLVRKDPGKEAPTRLLLLKKALTQLRKVQNLRIEKLGMRHPDTERTAQALQHCTDEIHSLSGSDGAQPRKNLTWSELSTEEYPELRTPEQFREVRERLRTYTVAKVFNELVQRGIVQGASKTLSTGTRPFNPFARLSAGIASQPSMTSEQPNLGEYQEVTLVVANRIECDEMYHSDDPTWIGKASMSKRHRMLILKDLDWEWFNVLTFGLVSTLEEGIEKINMIKAAATFWVKSQADWPPLERVGFYVHVYAHCSVNAFHLHIVDLDSVGPTYAKMAFKNLTLDAALAVLQLELKERDAAAEEAIRAGTRAIAAAAEEQRAAELSAKSALDPDLPEAPMLEPRQSAPMLHSLVAEIESQACLLTDDESWRVGAR